MTEDSIYRESSQFKTWSFPPSKLAEIRQQTNIKGIKSVNRQWKKARQEAGDADISDANDPECLTVDEELTLLRFYCGKVIELSDLFGFPSNVKSSAVIFLQRFHLHHSILLYHPKHHLPTVLFLATKTENHYIPLSDFCKRIPKSTPEAILKHEFIVAGGIGWDLDIRHPLRAVEGGIMELLTLISQGAAGRNSQAATATSTSTNAMTGVVEETEVDWKTALNSTSESIVSQRIKDAHGNLRNILTSSALISDAYFCYTPPQIFLGALYTADQSLAQFYINWKLNGSLEVRDRLMKTVQACSEMLRRAAEGRESTSLEEVKRIDKKLHRCQNPQKYTGVGVGGGNGKSGGGGGNGEEAEEERKAKKRRLERERLEKEGSEVFGKTGGGAGGGGGSGNLFGGMLPASQN